MALDAKILHNAEMKLEADRAQHRERFLARRDSIYRRSPRLAEVERQLQGTMGKIMSRALRQGQDPSAAVHKLREENLALQEEKKELLRQLGLKEEALKETALCPVCDDTGYYHGTLCGCLRRYYAAEQQKELSRMLDLQGQSFDNFRLDYYSDGYDSRLGRSIREYMERIYDICADYAGQFGRRPENLLFSGDPGLGKTFLSAAIAREVSAAGWSVVYDTAGHIFNRFEADRFNRDREEGEAGEDVSRMLNCDLLILDDLGTEMTTTFVQSALYQIINTRLLEHRSTIISTNLKPAELSRRYSAQVASRIEGEYQILAFFGEDIRKKKREMDD